MVGISWLYWGVVDFTLPSKYFGMPFILVLRKPHENKLYGEFPRNQNKRNNLFQEHNDTFLYSAQ